MIIKNDFHIHTHCSCDSASAQIPDIVRAAKEVGLQHFGISDHLHTRFNLPDVEVAAKEFREFGPVPGFHFGIEISCATLWECEKIAKRDYASCFKCTVHGHEFQTMTPIDGVMYGGPANGPLWVDITKEEIDRLGIEYLIGGVHKPNYTEQEPKTMIDDFFNQSCYLLNHEFIDILAHPWDMLTFWSGWNIVTHDPNDLDPGVYFKIPQEYWDELEHLFKANHKLCELNAFMLYSRKDVQKYYLEHIAKWRDAGVKFTFGSDLHGPQYAPQQREGVENLIAPYGFTEADFQLPPRLKGI